MPAWVHPFVTTLLYSFKPGLSSAVHFSGQAKGTCKKIVMYLQLLRRTRYIQRPVKQLWLPCRLEQITRPDGHIDEHLLLLMIPPEWLPDSPRNILLSIAHSRGSTGLKGVKEFRPWGRLFDCYVLELWHDEPRR